MPDSVVYDSIGVRAGELLSEDRLRTDVAAIVSTGWFADANVRVEPLRDGVRVAFLVIENPVIDEIALEGNTVFPAATILQALNVATGQVLNLTRLRDGTRAIDKLYEDRGYALSRVADAGVVTNGVVRLRVRILEVRVEAVQYKGLVKTQRFVVNRGALVVPGRIFNVNELNKDLQRLFALQLFDNVQARPIPGTTPEQVIVEIEVKEQRTQQARFGLGYSDQTGIAGLIEYSERNWKGRDQTVIVRAELGLGFAQSNPTGGQRPNNFLVSFQDPWIDAKHTSMAITLFETVSAQAEYTSTGFVDSRYNLDNVGSTIAFTRSVDPVTTLTLRLTDSNATITPLPLFSTTTTCPSPPPTPNPCPPPTLFTPGRSLILSLTGVRDTRDSTISATKGEKIASTIDIGIPYLGGQFGYVRLAGDYTRYFPMGTPYLVTRIMLGFGAGDLPLQGQYQIGGPETLRGYPVGRFRGNSFGVLNFELRAPLGGLARQLRNFTGMLYVDVGTAPLSVPLSFDYGIGTSVGTPLGLIRIDYAVGSGGAQTWLTVGQPF